MERLRDLFVVAAATFEDFVDAGKVAAADAAACVVVEACITTIEFVVNLGKFLCFDDSVIVEVSINDIGNVRDIRIFYLLTFLQKERVLYFGEK